MALRVASEGGTPSNEDYKLETLELGLLLTGLAKRYGYDFRQYAAAPLTRRVRHAMQREEVPTMSSLLDKLLRDSEAMARFVELVSVQTTSMFRDPRVYRSLRTQVLPMLRTYPFLRIWHAGCSTGEEVYSLAILLHEEGLYDRCRIYATDLSDRALERAKRGIVPLRVMRDYTIAYRNAGGQQDFSSYYIAGDEHAVLRQSLRRNVVFSQHNLVCDRAFNEFHLILCRNVLIYFDPRLRERAHQLFYESLGHFGVLVLGTKESLRYTGFEPKYRELDEGLRIYRRVR
jgi:chemotaxis protein methyltransferase CheR